MPENAEKGYISSPEQLNDYLKVTTPRIWILLVAVILIIVAMLAWSSSAVIESYAAGTAKADNGALTISFDDQQKAAKVKAGMEMEIGDAKVEVLTVGTDNNGNVVATAYANLPDGSYDIRVGYSTTQVLSMLFN